MGWIKTIIIHCCLDFIKQKNRFTNKTVESGQANDIIVDNHILENVSAMEIRQIITQLPGATAAVLICTSMKILLTNRLAKPGHFEGTSKWHVNEARRLLKKKLEHYLIPK